MTTGFSVAVIAGTGEATDLINAMPSSYHITAFVATDYGKTILQNSHCTVQVGRRDAAAFLQALQPFDAVVDASHPFATEVTRIVRSVCQTLSVSYFRLGRPAVQYTYPNIQTADSKEEAAAMLSETAGNLLFTTGANTLAFYAAHVLDFERRAWVRVLDTPESHKAAAAVPQAQILYGMPPFSAQDTAQIIESYGIQMLISKDSGTRGGLPEKIQAAEQFQIPVLLIRSPEHGETVSAAQILCQLEQLRTERGFSC